MKIEKITQTYFKSWQEPIDFEKMATCLDNNVQVDLGFFKANGKEGFINMLSQNTVPWKDIILLDSKYSQDFACIIYEGINSATNVKMRVAEMLTFKNDKIVAISSVISQLNH